MIPKVIHYCWFGGKPLPESALKCINSWKKYLPGYEIMRWDESKKVVAKQMRLFREFSDEEKVVMSLFEESDVVYLDRIITETMLSPTKIASILLSLEFDGVLTALPGKRYQKL